MLTPKEIVVALDNYIIGQSKAKRAVAIALRNRYRRLNVDEQMQSDICPKNIIMMGPTGVGKTEIARRLAKILDTPFVKVEATKFTEVGYVGRDVDSMIRDLIEVSIRMTKELKQKNVQSAAETAAESRLINILTGKEKVNDNAPGKNVFDIFFSNKNSSSENKADETTALSASNEQIVEDYKAGKLEDYVVDISVEQTVNPFGSLGDGVLAMGIDISSNDITGGLIPKQKKIRKVKVKEARKILIAEEADKLIDMDEVTQDAIYRAEQTGIIFIDELDKIAVSGRGNDHDVSREGVQRDILPVVEGCTINTKYGPVHTDHILFIAAGAFHMAKVSDLIPELQGRFPIRVELDALTQKDFKLILTQPQNAAIKQYEALLAADNVYIDFSEDAIDLIAQYAEEYNESCENIGARRLHTILENLLDEILFTAGENGKEKINVHINGEYVKTHISGDVGAIDPDKYIV